MVEPSHPTQASLPWLIGAKVSNKNCYAPPMTSNITRAPEFVHSCFSRAAVDHKTPLMTLYGRNLTDNMTWLNFSPVQGKWQETPLTTSACVQLSRLDLVMMNQGQLMMSMLSQQVQTCFVASSSFSLWRWVIFNVQAVVRGLLTP